MAGKRTAYLLLGLLIGLTGCERGTRQSVKAHPPEPVVTPQPEAQQTAKEPVSSPASPQKSVDTLIASVETAFQAGEQDYKAGHLGKARKEFDRALDLLLASELDLHSDPRLEELFDRIVSTVHAYELAAFREGDDFTEQGSEPAAIDEIAELTFPVDPRLKEKVEGELRNVPSDLPLTVNDQVLSYLNFFQTPRGRAIVENGLRRSGRYRDMILRILGEEGLPLDLIYLAQAESAFQPLARSRAGARGMWQFMSSRAAEYGLRRSWWFDDRLDPEKSTRAAARHLRDLYGQFQDWYLAIAAYNSGPGGVSRAIERTGYADFWELYNRNALPRETRNYVPIILSLTLIAKDPQRYGIEVQPDPPVRTEIVKPGHPIDLRLVAETIDVSVETLRALNPKLLRMATPADPEFELHVPEGTADRFFNEIASVPPEKWVSWRRHRIEAGETLSGLARRYRVPTRAIADANGITTDAILHIGDKLVIPATARRSEVGKLVRYRVRRGDTLSAIAGHFDVSVAQIKRWNGLRSDRIARGAVLKIYPGGILPASSRSAGGKAATTPTRAAKSASTKRPEGAIVHRVQPGDTLWAIARAYQTTVEALRAANRFLATRQIRPGDLLTVLPPQ